MLFLLASGGWADWQIYHETNAGELKDGGLTVLNTEKEGKEIKRRLPLQRIRVRETNEFDQTTIS